VNVTRRCNYQPGNGGATRRPAPLGDTKVDLFHLSTWDTLGTGVSRRLVVHQHSVLTFVKCPGAVRDVRAVALLGSATWLVMPLGAVSSAVFVDPCAKLETHRNRRLSQLLEAHGLLDHWPGQMQLTLPVRPGMGAGAVEVCLCRDVESP
jgi:hypothetical protein